MPTKRPNLKEQQLKKRDRLERYGKTWRCWENKPSPADLAEPFEKMEEKGA